MTTYQQTELWPDPQPWRTQMENDAFEIAFPEEERVEGDKVTIFMDFKEAVEEYNYSEWTWDDGEEANFIIEVRWEVPRVSQFNPVNKRWGHARREVKTYEKKEALQFWLDLMRKGAET